MKWQDKIFIRDLYIGDIKEELKFWYAERVIFFWDIATDFKTEFLNSPPIVRFYDYQLFEKCFNSLLNFIWILEATRIEINQVKSTDGIKITNSDGQFYLKIHD